MKAICTVLEHGAGLTAGNAEHAGSKLRGARALLFNLLLALAFSLPHSLSIRITMATAAKAISLCSHLPQVSQPHRHVIL